MTGYTVHTGSSKKFAAGWDQIFKGQKSGAKEESSKKTTPPSGKTQRATRSRTKS